MKDKPKPIGVDSEGFEVLTSAILSLMKEYEEIIGTEIYFEELGKDSGIAFSANDGALVMSEKQDILGGYMQTCQYPFYVVFRISGTRERQKLQAQIFLDSIGKWLCMEPAEIKGEVHILKKYPELTSNRKITRVTRLNSYGLEPNSENVQDWILPVTVQYTNQIAPKW